MNMTSREFYKMLSLTLSGGNTISCFFVQVILVRNAPALVQKANALTVPA